MILEIGAGAPLFLFRRGDGHGRMARPYLAPSIPAAQRRYRTGRLVVRPPRPLYLV